MEKITEEVSIPKKGLTTGNAAFIEEAKSRNEIFIKQPHDLYSEENHATWHAFYTRMMAERWPQYAHPVFLRGVELLQLDKERIPKLDDINKNLYPLTGFQARPVSGYISAHLFFDCLSKRHFPTTITIRDIKNLFYIKEPDIIHDVGGHVPMHTSVHFANTLVRFGACARTAVVLTAVISNKDERMRRLKNIIKGLARVFWFTIEFGLIKDNYGLRAYGSGLLSSHGELAYAIDSSCVQRHQVRLEWMINQAFEIDHYQPLLFYIASFEQLFELVDTLEKWLSEGKLNNIAPGYPETKDEDLQSFLEETERISK